MWNYNDEAGFSQVLHLDVPRSGVPGSENGLLVISGGLALPSAEHFKRQTTSLQGAIASLTPLLLLEYLGTKANESMRQYALTNLPGHVSILCLKFFIVFHLNFFYRSKQCCPSVMQIIRSVNITCYPVTRQQ